MKSTLFIRPNLKLFVLVAIALVALEQFLSSSEMDKSSLLLAATIESSSITEAELDRLVEQAVKEPDYESFILISNCYRKLGNPKKAMRFLRHAGTIAKVEDLE